MNHLVKKVPYQVIKQINQKVSFRLLTKSGQTGVIHLIKCIALVVDRVVIYKIRKNVRSRVLLITENLFCE